MKNTSLFLLFLLFISCKKNIPSLEVEKAKNNGIRDSEYRDEMLPIPHCSDESVKEQALGLFKEQVRENLIDNQFRKNFNISDLVAYAKDHNLDRDEFLTTEKQAQTATAVQKVDEILRQTYIGNIRTDEMNNEIKKCSCSGEIILKNQSYYNISYTGQFTEDTEKLFVEINYFEK